MRRDRDPFAVRLVALTLGLSFAAGCRVEANRQPDRGGDNVRVATPFGGMSVKTDDNVVQQSTGLPAYPGAILLKKDKDTGAADIDLAIGSFQLRVKAVGYRTSDAPEQVADFYRTALGRYGDVIQCANNVPVGTPARTSQGLTCDDDGNKKVNYTKDSNAHIELKAGSKSHQHLVEIGPDGTGTKFGLVALDLPSHIVLGDDNDKDNSNGKDTRQ
jgi:hypothetical protein